MSGEEFCNTDGPPVETIQFTLPPTPSIAEKRWNKCSIRPASEVAAADHRAPSKSDRMIIVMTLFIAGIAYLAAFLLFLLGSAGLASLATGVVMFGACVIAFGLGTLISIFIIISSTPFMILLATFILFSSLSLFFGGSVCLLTALCYSWIFDYFSGFNPPLSRSFFFCRRLFRRLAAYAAGSLAEFHRGLTDRYDQRVLSTCDATVEVQTISAGTSHPEIHSRPPIDSHSL